MKNAQKALALLLSLLLCLSLLPGAAAMEAEELPVEEPAEEPGLIEPTPVEEATPAALPAPFEEATPAALPVPAAEAQGTVVASGACGENLTWTLDDAGLLTISGTGEMTEHPWLDTYQNSIVTLLIEDGVTSVASAAFYGCAALTDVTIGNSVTTVGSSAFSGCAALTDVTIGNSVTTVGSHAFSYCSALSSVTIPSSVTYLGDYGFGSCGSIAAVYISDLAAWLSIRTGTYECRPRGQLYLNGKILREAEIPRGISRIPDYAFCRCSGLVSVSIPDGVSAIGEAAFASCGRLTELVIPDSVTEIGQNAFQNCSGLSSLTLSRNLTAIKPYTFSQCSNLANVTIPDGVTSIGDHAFYVCSSLTSVTIPSSVTSIGYCAFFSCSSLTSVTIPAGVTSIGGDAFLGCSGLTSVTIPSSVTSIGYRAFSGCSGLTSITIPASVTGIGGEAFSRCNQLKTIRFLGNAPSFDNDALATLTATAYYPDDRAWESYDLYDYGGSITWVPYVLVNITAQPEDQLLLPGETASFAVSARGDNLSYQWYSMAPAGTWEPIPGADSATCSVEAADALDGCQYRCEVTDAYLTLASEPAELRILKAPVILEQPEDLSVLAGAAAEFSVLAEGEELSYQWYYKAPGNSSFRPISAASGKTAHYTLTAESRHNGYQYRCVVSNRAGSVASEEATLTVNAKPVILTQPQDASVRVGDTAVFSVTATGPSLSYQWQWRAGESGTWANSSRTGNKTASMSVPATEARDGQQYRCRISNSAGTVFTLVVTLHVDCVPILLSQPEDAAVPVGETAQFTVAADGPSLSYQWQWRAGENGTWANSGRTGCRTATLSVPATAARNGQQYRCIVSNKHGERISEAATLIVKLPGTVFQQPKDLTAAIGEDAVFNVKASGEDLHYQWQMQLPGGGEWIDCAETYAEGKILLVEATAELNGCLFRCAVSNDGGTVYSDTVTLTVTG